jgi:iron-sulfur cluster insertion protein
MSTETATTATQSSTEPQAPIRDPAGEHKAMPEAISDPDMAGALSLTETAADKVREIREAETIEPHYALRVKVMGGGCSGFQYDLYFDEHAEGDYVFESHGVKLVSDQMSFMYLMGTSIDYVEGLQGAGFKFNNPNTTGSCGCGSSFSV